jgi:hypothetical protein
MMRTDLALFGFSGRFVDRKVVQGEAQSDLPSILDTWPESVDG